MKIRDRLLKKFHDFKYRHSYVDDFTDAQIATQIRVLREQRELNQTELAEKAGMRQSQISELEDVNNRGWKVRTLKKLAKAFDLVLVVRFEEFGHVLPDITTVDERQRLQRASFTDDPVFKQSERPGASPSPAIEAKAKLARVLNAAARFTRTDASNVA